MNHDSEACGKADTVYLVWRSQLDEKIQEIADVFAQPFGVSAETEFYKEGAFNRCYIAKFKDRYQIIIRFPAFGRVSFRFEKVRDELEIINYLCKHTSIPTPKIYRVNKTVWGPLMAMKFVRGDLLSDRLKALSESPPRNPVLNQEIDLSILTKAYRGMAKILIHLSKCQFPRIGGLAKDSSGNWAIAKRPLTVNINQLVALGNFPPNQLPEENTTYSTATDYFVSLAQTHLDHLKYQRNDAIEDEEDCRRKYVARCLFLKAAKNFSTKHNNGPFRLYCDDIRPSNVIVDHDLNIRCIIDWEFSYSAPAEFTYCSPWWLLLVHPDDWEDTFDEFLEQYLPRHELFIQVMRECEDEAIKSGRLSDAERLSGEMSQSLKNGNFWFCLAATSSYGFDDIYWKFIDESYFGDYTTLEERMKLLDPEQQSCLDEFVSLKVQQAEENTLDEHRTLDEMFDT